MADGAVDLLAVDRDVRRAAQRVDHLRALLVLGTAEARDRARSFDPFDGVRHTAVKATYATLVELKPSLLDVPLRDGLVRWVHELLQTRVGLDLARDDADAETTPDPRLTAKQLDELKAHELARAARALDGAAPDDGRQHVAHTYREAFRAIAEAPDEALAAAALARAADLAPPVAAARKELRERRFEAARRLGLPHPFALASSASVHALATRLLDETEPFARELFKQARRTSEGPWRASSAIQLALGHGAREGWPAHLGQRWLDETFHAIAPRGVEIVALPEPLGSATFLRAAATWGFAWRTSGTPRSMPFALARDPYPVPAHRFGFTIASVIAEPSFQRRSLDLPARVATAQSRVLRRTMFLHARVIAARAMLAAEERVTPVLFEEITARVFGAPLPPSMRDAWPDPHTGEVGVRLARRHVVPFGQAPAQLLGLLGTQAFLRDLVQRYDDDWFRNPMAGKHLTSLACGPAFDLEPLGDEAPADLARAFEEALG